MKSLLLSAALVLPMVACNVLDVATPEQRAQDEALGAQIEAVEVEYVSATAEMSSAIELAQRAIEKGSQAALGLANEKYLAAVERSQEAATSHQELIQKRSDLHDEIVEGTAGKVSEVGLPFVPSPLRAPLEALGIAPLVGLLFKRSRRHLGTAGKSLSRLNFLDAGLALAKMLGYTHSSEASRKEAAREQIVEVIENEGLEDDSDDDGEIGFPETPTTV